MREESIFLGANLEDGGGSEVGSMRGQLKFYRIQRVAKHGFLIPRKVQSCTERRIRSHSGGALATRIQIPWLIRAFLSSGVTLSLYFLSS
jgi:hypothetical protein